LKLFARKHTRLNYTNLFYIFQVYRDIGSDIDRINPSTGNDENLLTATQMRLHAIKYQTKPMLTEQEK